MKNKLIDLNNALFEQLERIQNPDKHEKLEVEIKKAQSMNELSKNIIEIHKLAYKAAKEKGRDLDYLDFQFNGGIKAIAVSEEINT